MTQAGMGPRVHGVDIVVGTSRPTPPPPQPGETVAVVRSMALARPQPTAATFQAAAQASLAANDLRILTLLWQSCGAAHDADRLV
jgi:hypothetical protein